MRSRNNAKYFIYKEGNPSGIITYTAKNDKDYPKFSINENPSNLFSFNINNVHDKYKNGNPTIEFDTYPQDPAYLVVDFGAKYKASVSSYTIDMRLGATPPREWDLSGRNNENEEWSIISSPTVTDYLCGIPATSESTCTNATINKFMTGSDALFRYIRFRIIKARRQNYIYYRPEIEIYGFITGFLPCKTIYNRCKRNGLMIYVLIALHCF